ncbi:MAG: hypothetical protein AB7P02_24970, partial [Alphaproteobacteria bacterium]
GRFDPELVPFVSVRHRPSLERYLREPSPKAMAIAPDGAFGWRSVDSPGGGGRQGRQAASPEQAALARCRQHSKEQCVTYAIDDRVVWSLPAR